jgi:hypothetical protein
LKLPERGSGSLETTRERFWFSWNYHREALVVLKLPWRGSASL